MANRSIKADPSDTNARYLELVHNFPLRPIRSEAELDQAIALINSLLDRDDLDPGEEDYLDVLGDLVHKFESKSYPLNPVTDAEMLRFLLDSNEMSQTKLADASGIAESTVSEILSGKRTLNRGQIAALARTLHVSPSVFFPGPRELTEKQLAQLIKLRAGKGFPYKVLVALSRAFAAERACWRSFRDLVSGAKPGHPPEMLAERLNHWGDVVGCGWAHFHLSGADVLRLAGAFASEAACWATFRDMVEEETPEWKTFEREIAEEN